VAVLAIEKEASLQVEPKLRRDPRQTQAHRV